MKYAKDPSKEEVQIANEMQIWPTSLTPLTGYLMAEQEMVNLLTIELARGRNEAIHMPPSRPANVMKDPGCRRDRPFRNPSTHGETTTGLQKAARSSLFQLSMVECMRLVNAGGQKDIGGSSDDFPPNWPIWGLVSDFGDRYSNGSSGVR